MRKSVFLILLLLLLTAAVTGCSDVLVGYDDLPADSEKREETVTEVIPEGAIPGNIYLDISAITSNSPVMNLHGLKREEVEKKIKDQINFSLKVVNSNPDLEEFKKLLVSENRAVSDNEVKDLEEFELPDIVTESVDSMLDKIYAERLDDSTDHEETYSLEVPYSEYAEKYASAIHDAWSIEGAFNLITGFDEENNEFTFGGGHDGYEVDDDKLKENIETAFEEREFDKEIPADCVKVTVSVDALKEQYRELASYETHTTNIAVRNKNVSLAADSINGTIVQPGEEFSYNDTVGQRTKAKGYGEAGAYLNGEVVQEVGGGVCQVSTTLYNAIFRSGIKSTERTSHTFAPSYVTPGLDATVSWGGPDYKFVNNSPYPIGLFAHYENRKVRAAVYGIPLLPEGETWDLVSYKTATLGVPAPVYITSGKTDSGSAGSIWEAYKVIYKDGEEQERIFDHKSKYVGHTPRVYANPLIPEGMSIEEYNALLAALAAQQAQNTQ